MSVATRLEPRVTARARSRRRARLAVTLSVTVLLLVLGAAAWVLLGTSVLGVRAVEVTGVHRLSADTVRAVAAIREGTPLATLDTSGVADRVAGLPTVRSVEVRRTWPRTVTLVVRERTPAAVQQRGPSYVLVDRSGVAFDQVERRPPGLPLVSAPVDAGAPALRAALDVLDDLPAQLRGEVRQVRAGSPDRVQVLLTHGRTVVWGSAERGGRKAAVLAVLLTRKASVYDVSAPDAPTTRR